MVRSASDPALGRISSPVRLVFDLALGARCETQEVVLRPGEVLEATIPVNLNMMIRATCPGGGVAERLLASGTLLCIAGCGSREGTVGTA